MPSEACSEELETVLAIFLDDIQVVHHDRDHVLVSMILFPSTGDDTESKYVTLTLELLLPPEYPDKSPKITFRNPRGLSEEMLDTLIHQMKDKCEEILGCSMIFELIDMGKEFLTKNNRPAAECPICLLSFTEFDVFFRPSCFHHVHSFCLGKYLFSVTQSLANDDHLPNEPIGKYCCPVCRNEFSEEIDVQKFLSAPPPSEEDQEALLQPCVPEDWLSKQETLNQLFAKQKSQGGIIDLSEKDKKLLVISSPPRAADSNGTTATTEESTSAQADNNASIRAPIPPPPATNTRTQGTTPRTNNSRPQQHHAHHNHHHAHHHTQQPRHHNHQSSGSSSNNNPGLAHSASESSSKTHGTKDNTTNSYSHYRHRRRK